MTYFIKPPVESSLSYALLCRIPPANREVEATSYVKISAVFKTKTTLGL